MSSRPVAPWRVVGFDVVFVVLPVACVAVVAVLATNVPRWSWVSALGAAAIGALVGLRLTRAPKDSTVPGWVFTAALGAACFLVPLLSSLRDSITIVPFAFGTGLIAVISISLLVRRRRDPESFAARRHS